MNPLDIPSGLQEATRNESVSVANSSVVVAQSRAPQSEFKRKVITIRNASTDATYVVTLNFGPSPAVAGAGIILKPGESVTDSQEGLYDPWQGQITAICAVAGPATLAIFER